MKKSMPGYAACYWHEDCEPSGTYYGCDREQVEAALVADMLEQRAWCDEPVHLCQSGVIGVELANHISPEEWADCSDALLSNEVVYLTR